MEYSTLLVKQLDVIEQNLKNHPKKSAETTLAWRKVQEAMFWLEQDLKVKNESDSRN